MMGGAVSTAAGAVLQAATRQRLPGPPPINGPFWTIVVPGALLVVSILGSWLLYRRFSREE